jgi:hypothetical protein
VPRFVSRLFPSRLTLRAHLLALVLVSLVPVLIFSAVLLAAFTRHERGAVDQGSRETARALAAAVDHQLDGAIAALSALAVSSQLAHRDWRGFHDEARAVENRPGRPR